MKKPKLFESLLKFAFVNFLVKDFIKYFNTNQQTFSCFSKELIFFERSIISLNDGGFSSSFSDDSTASWRNFCKFFSLSLSSEWEFKKLSCMLAEIEKFVKLEDKKNQR